MDANPYEGAHAEAVFLGGIAFYEGRRDCSTLTKGIEDRRSKTSSALDRRMRFTKMFAK
jgi:hypothetical protein